MGGEHRCTVEWSEEDGEYVGLCAEMPSLSWLAPTENEAREGIRKLVEDAEAERTGTDRQRPERAGTGKSARGQNTGGRSGAMGRRVDIAGKTLAEEIAAGRAAHTDVEDWVDAWHEARGEARPIHEVLGLTREAYLEWLGDDSALERLLEEANEGT